ncbi:MAG: response regulator transcription factor [Acidimicrobiia bacterium]
MSEEGRLRIILVDDHDVVRAGMRAILDDDFDIVGEADNVDSAIELVKERIPDLVVLDVKLPGGGGATVIDAIRPIFPDVRFMALTVSTSKEDVARLLDAGVDGYVTKTTLGADLPDLIRKTFQGARPVSPDVAGYLLDIDEDIAGESAISKLTPREREVVNLIARGYTYRESAGRMGITVKTLENHMAHIFDKLSVASRHELTALAYEEGYVRPDDER